MNDFKKVSESLETALRNEFDFRFATEVSLKEISRWRIGGPAAVFAEPSSINEICALLAFMKNRPEPVVVVGGTSNILFDSDGFGGLVIKLGENFSNFIIEGSRIRAQAGASVPQLVRAVATEGLEGIVHAGGIPGTVGGLVVMNGGTQRRGIGEHVTKVLVTDAEGSIRELNANELQFTYRNSVLKNSETTVLEVELLLRPGNAGELLAELETILDQRSQKFPEDLPNCGSTFLSDPAMYSIVGPPGKAIEDAGLKGLRRGSAEISMQHANFIVNHGDASDDDILWLISAVRKEVYSRTGFVMDCEVLYLSYSGDFRPAHEVADEQWPDIDLVRN